MTSRRRLVALIAAGALAAVLGYLALWGGVSRQAIGRSDFTSTYVGATLLGEGHRGDLYDTSIQAPLHARLIAPDTEGNLPFVNPPAAAAAALPLGGVSLDTAFRLFGLLQLALLALAVLVASRAAPWPAATLPRVRLTVCLAAVAGLGTLNLLLLGQWDGVAALGIALGYAAARRGHLRTAGLVLTLGIGLAKPHLGLGLAALLLARRDRRLVAGAVAGVAALAAAALAAVGPAGVAGFLAHAAGASDAATPIAAQLSAHGLAVSWLGGTGLAAALAVAVSLAAVLGCAVLGDAWRRRPDRLEAALAGGVALSLLASPHLLAHDLTLLAPVLVWAAAAAARSDAGTEWPQGASLRVLGLWVALNAAAAADLGASGVGPPGRWVPVVLAVAGGAAWVAARPALPRPALAYSGRGRGAGGVVDQS